MNLDLEAKLSQFKANFRREVREAAQKLLTEEMPSITEELFGLYEKNGNRVLYERVYFTRRKFLAVFGPPPSGNGKLHFGKAGFDH